MPILRTLLSLAFSLLLAAPAEAQEQPGQSARASSAGATADQDKPGDPAGFRLGAEITSPYAVGAALAYLVPLAPFTFKAGADWGILSNDGVTALRFTDWRVYGALMYYFLPGANDGPYVELGLDALRTQGTVLALSNWPVVPHLGFGTILRLGTVVADVGFSATASGLVTLEAGVLLSGLAPAASSTTQPLPAWTPWEPSTP